MRAPLTEGHGAECARAGRRREAKGERSGAGVKRAGSSAAFPSFPLSPFASPAAAHRHRPHGRAPAPPAPTGTGRRGAGAGGESRREPQPAAFCLSSLAPLSRPAAGRGAEQTRPPPPQRSRRCSPHPHAAGNGFAQWLRPGACWRERRARGFGARCCGAGQRNRENKRQKRGKKKRRGGEGKKKKKRRKGSKKEEKTASKMFL